MFVKCHSAIVSSLNACQPFLRQGWQGDLRVERLSSLKDTECQVNQAANRRPKIAILLLPEAVNHCAMALRTGLKRTAFIAGKYSAVLRRTLPILYR